MAQHKCGESNFSPHLFIKKSSKKEKADNNIDIRFLEHTS